MDALFMNRCLQLAYQAAGNVAPNPMVGCVLVYGDQIVGEGFHEQFGGAHAEVNAINQVEDAGRLKQCTLYVNLEPCTHHGKTPPCADLIIEKKIPRVVIGCKDPNPLVSGKGIERLLAAGIEVRNGIEEDTSKELNKRFFTFHEKQRPFVLLKWAQSTDGFMAPADGHKTDISNNFSRTLMHRWRSEEAAVLVGTTTARIDNPLLDSRMWNGHHPLRLVLDRQLNLPASLHLFDHSSPTLVFTEKKRPAEENLEFITISFDAALVPGLLDILRQRGILSLMVEGGAATLQSFIKTHLWDEARIFTAPVGMGHGLSAPVINGKSVAESVIDGDRLYVFKNEMSATLS